MRNDGKRTYDNIGTLDSETDPFLYGRVPEPFVFGVYLNSEFHYFWGEECIERTVEYLNSIDCFTKLYVHNGGKFDFHFLLESANRSEITIINGRIAKMQIGQVTLIDSFLLLPFGLAKYQKTEIDYAKFEHDQRFKHRHEIIAYLKDDCIFLYNLITGFQDIVGKKLTIGGAAFHQMKKLDIKIPELSESHDEKYRKFYYGGRVQAFEIGYWQNRPYHYIDINSAYPYAMTFNHPTGANYVTSKTIDKNSGACFIILDAVANGCLPVREETGLLFPTDKTCRRYYATGWEVLAGLETKTLSIKNIVAVYTPVQKINFESYVRTFYKMKADAKASGNKIQELAAKFLLNSGYGKFATDPRKFMEYQLADYGNYVGDDYEWQNDYGGISLWGRPSYNGSGFYDVATSASITGYVRAYLFRALHACAKTGKLLYCDTDSIICERIADSVNIGEALGEYSSEGHGRHLAIGGKKLYAIEIGKEWKTASKGARLSAAEIVEVAKGATVHYEQAAPNFSIKYGARFIDRHISIV